MNTLEPNLAISPEHVAKLAPESRDALIGQLEKASYPADQLAKLKGTSAPPFAGDGGNSSKPISTFAPSGATQGVSIEQRAAAIRNLLARGIIDRAGAAQVARIENVDPSVLTAEPAAPAEPMREGEANARLAAQSGTDAASLSPADFGAFQYDREIVADIPADELQATNEMLASAFHHAGVPIVLGQGLAAALMRSAARFDGLDDVSRELAFREERARFARAAGIRAQQIAESADLVGQRLPPDVLKILLDTYVLRLAETYIALAHAGERIRLREARQRA